MELDDLPWFASAIWSVFAISLAALALLGGRHAFVHESFLLAESSPRRRSLWSNFGLLVASLIVLFVTFTFLMQLAPTTNDPQTTYSIAMDRNGKWREVRTILHGFRYDSATFAMRPAGTESPFQDIDEDHPWSSHGQLQSTKSNRSSFTQFKFLNNAPSEKVNGGIVVLFFHRGRILVYRQFKDLVAVITPDGTFRKWEEATGRFQSLKSYTHSLGVQMGYVSLSGKPLLSDQGTVYQFDGDQLTMKKLIDGNVDGLGMILPSGENGGSLWTLQGEEFTRFEIESEDPNLPLPKFDDPVLKKTREFSLPLIRLGASTHYSIADIDRLLSPESIQVFQDDFGKFGISQSITAERIALRKLDESASTVVSLTPNTQNKLSLILTCLVAPPITLPLGIILHYLVRIEGAMPPSIGSIAPYFLIHAIVGAGVSLLAARRRDLPRNKQLLWGLLGGAIGLSTPLAILAIYKRRHTVACPECGKHRYVEEILCLHCQGRWPQMTRDEIEIFSKS